ncbi:MAG: hypothetical protein IPO92_12250 [Saprospiraceae bacterium]|nr:hypothetical protein [Saprospiraceae bacterium]
MLLLFLLPVSFIVSQSGFTTLGGANFLGYGRAGITLEGIESIYLNQAGLTGVKNMAFDLSAERRFNLQDLSTICFSGAKSFKFGTIGVMASNFGITEYNEQKFGLAYARKLSKLISIGGQFDMLRLNVSQFGSKNIFTFEIGMLLMINKEFTVATHVFSPGNITISEGNDLGTRFRMGLKYTPSPKVFLLAEMDKLIYRKIEYKIGVSYQAVKDLQVRLGVNPSTKTFCFGAMLSIRNSYKIATAYALNGNLGNTPAFSLQYQN